MTAGASPGAGNAANRRIIKAALWLVGLLSIPVIALILLQAGVLFACSSHVTASGVLAGHVEWRITKMQCRNGKEPYYDVAVGAEDKTLTTALTSRGSPVPVGVVPLSEGLVGVQLDRPRSGEREALVTVPLRRSGSPKERIDLQADGPRAASQRMDRGGPKQE
ncbi:MAG: hypothetical protein LCH61_10620 [Proteobacteria bacterium]|nr:hypothetical protein [Pseudomonadota bacterium]